MLCQHFEGIGLSHCSMISLWLCSLLQAIEVHCQGICSNHVNSSLDPFKCKGGMACLRNKLWSANVRDEECVWGAITSDCITCGKVRIDNGCSLASDSQGQTIFFRCAR